jgi:Flp pilus assembly protein TadB
MSRAERRAYKRLTKNQDPYALPAAAQRGRAARGRPPRPPRQSGEFKLITGRFLTLALGGAAAAGLLAFSFTWPNMPFALYVGLAVAVAWLVLAWAVRLAQRRAAGMPRRAPR